MLTNSLVSTIPLSFIQIHITANGFTTDQERVQIERKVRDTNSTVTIIYNYLNRQCVCVYAHACTHIII